MSDDKLLKTLGEAAREQAGDDPLDEQFDALSRGELDEARIEALAAMAADGVVPPDAVEAFRPLGEDFRRSVAARAAEALGASTSHNAESGAGTTAAPIQFPTGGPKRRSRMNLAPAALAASVMLAVGIGFFAIPRSGVAPIPGYTVLLQGGATNRSGAPTDEVRLFRDGDRFELRLTPATAVDGPVVARVYVDTAGGFESLDTPPAVLAPSGAVRIVGTAGADVALPAGESRLYVVLGREDALPAESDLRRAMTNATSVAGRGWTAWQITVLVDR